MRRLTPLAVYFYRSGSGREPVREWLKSLDARDRKTIGGDLKTLQMGWPLGMPLVRKLEPGLWEMRSRLDERIARIVLTVEGETVILLHGFIKKSRKMPTTDLETARERLKNLRGA